MTFFILNTIVIALFYGYFPSFLTIVLSIPLAFFFFVPPFDSFDMPTPQDSFVFLSYILIACISVGIVEWLQRERYKAVLISKVSQSNFQLLSQASTSLKKYRDLESKS
jgi:K+-sensing histidine kinase KdpD